MKTSDIPQHAMDDSTTPEDSPAWIALAITLSAQGVIFFIIGYLVGAP